MDTPLPGPIRCLQVQLAALLLQFDRDGDGVLDAREAARLVAFVAAGRLGGRQRDVDLAAARLREEADRDKDGLLSYNVGRAGLRAFLRLPLIQPKSEYCSTQCRRTLCTLASMGWSLHIVHCN